MFGLYFRAIAVMRPVLGGDVRIRRSALWMGMTLLLLKLLLTGSLLLVVISSDWRQPVYEA